MNRSPIGEALLADRLRSVATALVHSAGTRATLGGAAPEAITVASGAGLDLTSHRSRQLDSEMVDAADLVLGMAREHVREAVVLVPEAKPRSFTIKELVRRAGDVGPRSADEPVREWLARVDTGRTVADLLGAADHDDVADPIGRGPAAYRRALDEITQLVDTLVPLLGPIGPR